MDKIEEDIKSLERVILSEARGEVDQMQSEARQKADNLRLVAQAHAEAERKAILEQAAREAERIRSQGLATSQLKARTMQLEAREKLLGQVFDAVKQRFPEVTRSRDYEKIIIQLLREAMVQLNAKKAVVRADKVALKLLKDGTLEKLAGELKAELSLGKILEDGTGVIVEASQGRLHYDNTFETRLDRLQNGLRSAVYQILTGESK